MIEIELQAGTPFEVRVDAEGATCLVVPRSAVEAALLRSGTSYPVLVEGPKVIIGYEGVQGRMRVGPLDSGQLAENMSERLRKILSELAGEASFAWEPKPSGMFVPEEAIAAVKRAEKKLAGAPLEDELPEAEISEEPVP
jgi:hypothetical protein